MSAVAAVRPPGSVAGHADPLEFVFGGVAFRMHPGPGVRWELSDEHRRCRAPFEAGPVAARVDCVLSPGPELTTREREIRSEGDGDRTSIATGGVRASLRRSGFGHYAATARVSPDSRGCTSVVTALAGTIQQAGDGLVLHASGVEIDGGVALFVGPSGAGKTTVANHCPSTRAFARDRAAVYRRPDGWYAAVMAGGDPIELPPSPHQILPLRGVLRVRRGDVRAQIRALDPLAALVNLRESLQSSAGDPDLERRALERIARLHAEVPVGELRSVLGGDLTPLIRDWIEH
ncbi:MAG TPA: hypothetical protein RMH99_28055 [Sandaracinaceae bacterium LLY-WYZ-13_1]|nr:hypothetical protein [Sandaracinaceae bacterium LLY-WYZ-13_1]